MLFLSNNPGAAVNRKSEWAVERTAKIGRNLTVTITGGANAQVWCQWSAHPRRLSRKQYTRYRACRDDVVREISRRMGGPILVLEPTDDGGALASIVDTQP